MKFVIYITALATCGACCVTAASEQQILAELERAGAEPSKTIGLLKQLGSSYDDNDLSVGEVLEQAKDVSVHQCGHQQLVERNTKLAMFKLDSGQYEAVIELLEDAQRRQLEACLGDADTKLEKQTVGKLRKSAREDIELFYENARQFAEPERAIGDRDDVVAAAAGKFMEQKLADKGHSLAGKLAGSMTRKVTSKRHRRAHALAALRETCQSLRVNLEHVGELVNIAQAQRLDSALTPQLLKWAEVRKYCIELLGNKSPELTRLANYTIDDDSDYERGDDV